MSEEKKQPRGIRLTEDTFNKFKNIVEDLGGDQQQALAKLMEVYELEKGKEVLPEMRESIETFEGYVFAAVGMYRQVLEKCQDMKALVRTEYDTMLRSKDTVIQELQAQLETAKEIAKNTTAMEEKYKDLLKEAHSIVYKGKDDGEEKLVLVLSSFISDEEIDKMVNDTVMPALTNGIINKKHQVYNYVEDKALFDFIDGISTFVVTGCL